MTGPKQADHARMLDDMEGTDLVFFAAAAVIQLCREQGAQGLSDMLKDLHDDVFDELAVAVDDDPREQQVSP